MFVMYHSDGSQWPAKQQNTMDGWMDATFYFETITHIMLMSILQCYVAAAAHSTVQKLPAFHVLW